MAEVLTQEGTRRLRTSYFSAVLSLTLVLFMVGLLGILILDARKLATYVKEHVTVSVYLNDDIAADRLAAFSRELESAPFARQVQYISKEEALYRLTHDLGEDVSAMLESNPLPASLEVLLRADYAHPDSLEAISAALSLNREVVQEVGYQRDEVDRISRNFRSVALGLAGLSAILLIIAVALINHTIRLSLFASRFVIKSMQLVGAKRSFIRRPFLKRSFRHGLTAGIIAAVLLAGVLYFIDVRFPGFGQLSDPRSVAVLLCGILGTGVLLSAMSTYFAVNKYLRLRVDELY
ncbi:MAG: hypothetical protein RL021_1930 [Bacteroidota bacterium]|jgi:cell division transport system permease protein